MTINYNNGKIYKIVDNKSDMIYVGSTCKTLEQRIKSHISNYKNYKAGKYHNISSFKILENNNYKIELVKLYPCVNNQELELQEGNIIKEYKNEKLNVVNKCIVGQTKAQYRQSNNKHINEKANQKHNCQCGGSFSNKNKSRHEKSKKHCQYINNSKNINIETLNLNITVNNSEDLAKIIKTINKL